MRAKATRRPSVVDVVSSVVLLVASGCGGGSVVSPQLPESAGSIGRQSPDVQGDDEALGAFVAESSPDSETVRALVEAAEKQETGESQGRKSALFAAIHDDENDTDPDAPPFIDIRAAAIQGTRDTITFVLEFTDDLPLRMEEDGEILLAGFGLKFRTGEDATLYGRATTEGWALVRAESGRDEVIVRDAVAVEGQTVGFALSWSELGPARQFRWGAISSLIEIDDTGAATSFEDRAPENPLAHFPDR